MSKQDFLKNLRIAGGLFAHPSVKSDSPHLEQRELDEMAKRITLADLWLTPKSVQGFEPNDFSELGHDRQKELQIAVQQFRDVAIQVPPDKPATPEQYRTAKGHFEKILKLLDHYIPTTDEIIDVDNALLGIEFPPWVVDWNFELGSDEDDEPAVWVNIFIDRDKAPGKELGRFALGMTQKIREALSAAGIDRWPFVRIRTAVEHKMV